MFKKLFFIFIFALSGVRIIAQPSNPQDVLHYYNQELEKLEKEIAEKETEYAATLNKALLGSLNSKKAKRELLNMYGSKAAKRISINFSTLTFFSKVETLLQKQKELEQKYDLKINFNADAQTVEELKGLGVNLLKTVTKNESSIKNRSIDVTFHYYKDAFKIGYKVILSQPLASELNEHAEIEEQLYDISQSSSGSNLLTTEYIIYLESQIKFLTIVLNPSNIAEFEKLKNADNTFSFMSPAGIPFTIPAADLQSVSFYFNDKTPASTDITSFRADGALQAFSYTDSRYDACYVKGQTDMFTGYGISVNSSTSCPVNKYKDEYSKVCSQKDCVIVATACMENGALKFNVKKIPITSPATWPTADHNGSGEYKPILPVNYGSSGKTTEIRDYTFSNQYNQDAKEFLSKHNNCESKYVPYVMTIANLINTIPDVYKRCYSKKWFIDNFALFNCAICTTGHFDKYAARVSSLRTKLDQLGSSALAPLSNSQILSLTSPQDLYDYVSDYTYCDFGYLSKAQRTHIVKTLSSVAISDDYERVLLSIMGALEEHPQDINDFLNSLIDPANNVNGKTLLFRMFDDFDDLEDNAYTSLVIRIASLVGKSTLPNLDFPDYSNYTNYYPDSRMFILDYNCYDNTSPSETSSCLSWLPGFTRYGKIEMLVNGSMHIKSKTKGTEQQQNGNGQIYYNFSTNDYTLHPFQLISFADNSDLDEISQFIVGDGSNVIMPACFLEYAMYAKFKQQTWKNVAIAGDILLIASGAAEISVAVKAFRSASTVNKIISGARVGWGAAQMAGGMMDLSIRMSNDVDEEFKGFVEKYNMAIVILSLPTVYKGLEKLGNGTLKYANKTYNNVAHLITSEKPLLTTYNYLKNELLTRIVVYNMKLNQANAVKALRNQALLAESDYLTNNFIKVFDKSAYDEAVLTEKDFVLKSGYLVERFIAKTGSELREHLEKIVTFPTGKTYSGDLYRSLSVSSEVNYGALPTQMTDHYIYSSWGRYDLDGAENAMYLSKTLSGNQTEIVPHYGEWSAYSTYKFSSTISSNLLDLTDDLVRQILGTEYNQLVLLRESKAEMYEFTNELASWARKNGYNGLIVPGARGAKNYENIILFSQNYVTEVLNGKVVEKIVK